MQFKESGIREKLCNFPIERLKGQFNDLKLDRYSTIIWEVKELKRTLQEQTLFLIILLFMPLKSIMVEYETYSSRIQQISCHKKSIQVEYERYPPEY